MLVLSQVRILIIIVSDNIIIIFIGIIAPKWIHALLKLAYFLSRDLSSTPGYLA